MYLDTLHYTTNQHHTRHKTGISSCILQTYPRQIDITTLYIHLHTPLQQNVPSLVHFYGF